MSGYCPTKNQNLIAIIGVLNSVQDEQDKMIA